MEGNHTYEGREKMGVVCYVGGSLVIRRGGKREVEGLWRFQLGSPKQHKEQLGSNLMNSMNIQTSECQGEDSC